MKDSGFLRDEADQGGERFRWTDGKARLVIPMHEAPPRAIHVDLYAIRPRNVTGARVELSINGRELWKGEIPVGAWQKTFALADINVGEAAVVDIISDTFVPQPSAPNGDGRTLGVEVRGITLLRHE